MPNFVRNVALCAVWLMGLAHPSPLAAQLPVDQKPAAGIANIYNLDRDARVGSVEIYGQIDNAVASQAIKLIRSIRPDVDELTVFLSSRGGDVLAAIELGDVVRQIRDQGVGYIMVNPNRHDQALGVKSQSLFPLEGLRDLSGENLFGELLDRGR